MERSVIRDKPSPDYAEFIIGPAHRVRPLAGPMAGSGRTRWLIRATGGASVASRDRLALNEEETGGDWQQIPTAPTKCAAPTAGIELSPTRETLPMKPTGLSRLLGAVAFALGLSSAAFAQSSVKVGAIYPLSGVAASVGVYAKAAIEVAVDIVNNDHPELGDLPLAKGAGLTGLGGAKLEVVFADNQGTPAAGQNQAVRLITEEKVVAINGAYQSGITLTASAAAERYGIPFLTGDSVAANLTERGFRRFFRTRRSPPTSPAFTWNFSRI
jgi:branched-chain amino acid transport system substrate-binding protein